jgi:hypothetical protein
MKNVILKSGKCYSISDFNLDTITKNADLLSELEMDTLPETLYRVLGIYPEDLYIPILLAKLELYDKSDNVNSFIYKDKKYWLDKHQRTCLYNTVNKMLEDSKENIELVLGNEVVIFSTNYVKKLLLDLETYSHKCFVNTMKHKNMITSLNKVEDILSYDYTKGYPEKIVIE